MEKKFTPGPWEVQEDYDGWSIINPKVKFGTEYIAREINQGFDGGEADSKLIAAAPELLEALIDLSAFVEEICKNISPIAGKPSRDKAKQAIKKAIS